MSPSVLSQRLTELTAAGIVQQDPSLDYALTVRGKELLEALVPLSEWATHWRP
jgi:DNA-binding HxlR family transcriptional regulator